MTDFREFIVSLCGRWALLQARGLTTIAGRIVSVASDHVELVGLMGNRVAVRLDQLGQVIECSESEARKADETAALYQEQLAKASDAEGRMRH